MQFLAARIALESNAHNRYFAAGLQKRNAIGARMVNI